MIGENLRKVLEGRGVKPAEISRQTGIPTSRISEILTGKTQNPGIDTLFRISEVVGANLNFIASGKGEMFEGERVKAQAEGLDKELVRVVIEAVEEGLGDLRLELKPDKKAQLVITLCEMFQEEKQVDKPTILRLIKLAA